MKKTTIVLAIIAVLTLAYYFLSKPKKVEESSVSKEKVTIGMVTFPSYAPLYLEHVWEFNLANIRNG
jgi:hypothetical protein